MRFFNRKRRCATGRTGRGMRKHQTCPGDARRACNATNLADLQQRQCAIVKRSSARGLLGQKLVNMGFVPGAKVCMIRNAPLRDPIEIGIQNYMVTLRRTEAALIEVEST